MYFPATLGSFGSKMLILGIARIFPKDQNWKTWAEEKLRQGLIPLFPCCPSNIYHMEIDSQMTKAFGIGW